MTQSKKFAVNVAGALIVASTLFSASAFAQSRGSNNSWRNNDRGSYQHRNDYDRGSIRGVVTSIDRRSGELLLRDQRTGRTVNVEMRRRGRNSRGIDFSDLRRGDRVSFEGEWENRRVFKAYRIDRLNSRR